MRNFWMSAFCACMAFSAGILVGGFAEENRWRRQTVEHGHAYYNRTNGVWQWVEPVKFTNSMPVVVFKDVDAAKLNTAMDEWWARLHQKGFSGGIVPSIHITTNDLGSLWESK